MRNVLTVKSNVCPFGLGSRNNEWWPNNIDINLLHKNSILSNPLNPSFNYSREFNKIDMTGTIHTLCKHTLDYTLCKLYTVTTSCVNIHSITLWKEWV